MTKMPHEHHMAYHCHKGVTGEYIGQMVEIPEIIVHASSKEKLKEEIIDAMNAYFDAFPDQHDNIFKNNKVEIEKITINR